MVKAIIFDLGGVLVSDVFTILDKTLAKEAGVTPKDVYSIRRNHWTEYELGKISGVEFMSRVLRALDLSSDPDKILAKTFPLIKADREMIGVVKRLRLSGKFKLGVLSNNSKEWSQYSKDVLGLGKYFDSWIVSCDLGMKKNQKEIYIAASKSLGLAPEECLFIDNKEVNVEGAKSVGMEALHFSGKDKLVKQLKDIGIDV